MPPKQQVTSIHYPLVSYASSHLKRKHIVIQLLVPKIRYKMMSGNDNSTSVTEDTLTGNLSNISTIHCPSFTKDDEEVLLQFMYWVGGVGVCVVSITGFLLNLAAVCVLLTRLF